jgi:cytochrome c-type biogenesis protein CcmH/NrfF
VESTLAPPGPRNEIEKRLGERLVCLCGSCGKEPIGRCTCGYAAGIRREIETLVDAGRTEEEIVQHFIDQFGGQQLLAQPVGGIGRAAWLLPYLIGAAGVGLVGFVAVRWTRRPGERAADAPAAEDPDLERRLDDELRNLD